MARRDHFAGIERVKAYVRSTPYPDLRLERLARIARLSPFHFHRVFSSVSGESLGSYVQRTRLERGAHKLREDPTATVTDAAFYAGYESSDGFSRAFRRTYGLRPSEWDRSAPLQERRIGRSGDDFPVYDADELRAIGAERGFSVEIAELPAAYAVFVSLEDAYRNPEGIVAKYRQLTDYLASVGEADGQLYGTSWDDPDVAPVERCTFEWAAEVSAEHARRSAPTSWDGSPIRVEGGPGLACRRDEARLVARIHVRGDLKLEDAAWQYLFRVWLPNSRYVLAFAPAMEIYRAPPDAWAWERFDLWCALPVSRV